jgi:hypothetical protein
MGIDLRIPIGLMFLVMGLLLAGYGLLGDRAIYARSLGVNVNLIWGLVLIVFATVMIGLAWLRRRRRAASDDQRAG